MHNIKATYHDSTHYKVASTTRWLLHELTGTIAIDGSCPNAYNGRPLIKWT